MINKIKGKYSGKEYYAFTQMGKMIDTIGEERLMEFIEVGIEIRKIMKELPEDVEELEGEDR